jgi:hypothetical protein
VDEKGDPIARGQVFIGRWEARATPVADTLKGTKLDDTVKLAPGTYDVLFAGKGFGLKRAKLTVKAGQKLTERLAVETNLASKASGAKVVGASEGSLNVNFLIDDTEATNWAGVNTEKSVDEQHPFVVVDLAGGKQTLRSARVSAMLRPAPASATDIPLAQEDPLSGSRFTALRKFALETCIDTAKNDCTKAGAKWTRVYVSDGDAFPSVRPRPVAPTLALRSFEFPKAVATHVRLVALENQCTGFKGYAGELDNDPTNDTDCKSASDRDLSVRAAELQLFG